MANCIIAQSGGPTSVINSSVVGLIDANKDLKIFDKVYAGLNGIEGILNGNIIELSSFSDEEINSFRYTPSSGLGSCRYKMKKLEESTEEYDKLLEILKAMQQDIKGLKESQERLENKIDGVVEQTADLLEFRTQITDTVQQIKIDVEAIKKDVTNVEVITASNWADIAKLKAVK